MTLCFLRISGIPFTGTTVILLVETDVTDEMVRKRFVGEVGRLKKSQEDRKSPLYRLKVN